MPGIFFTNIAMLAGLTALSIPVIIHLLLKRKKKRLRFSTIQFFVKQDEQSSRRRKLRNWLLLALRLLIFTLLVLAFARPYLPNQQANAGQKKRRVVLVLDRSASMRSIGTDGQRWSRAKERVLKILSELKPDDRAALIAASSHTDVVSGFAEPAAVAKVLGDLQPAYGTSNLGDGLQQAAKLLSHVDPNSISTVYVVSDFQRSACQSLSSYPIPQELEIKLLAIGDVISPNAAINDLQIGTHERPKPQVTVANFSDEESPELTLDVAIDGNTAISRTVSLSAGASTNVEFSLPALKPGWHEVKASLRSKDALELDNTRYASMFVPEPLRAWIVESKITKRAFEEESFFIATALDPTKDSTNFVQATFNVSKMTPDDLVSRLSANQTQLLCDLVIVPGLKQVPTGSGKALTAYVQAGGGLVLFLGEGISANRYNSEFQDVLPAQLGNLDASTDAGGEWRISEFDTNTVMFASFRLPNTGDLRIPTFTKRYTLTVAEDAAQPTLFDDGVPLVVTRALGRGRVALVNTSADTSWNDWPKHKTFVPWLHGLGKYLAQKAGQDTIQPTNNFVAGDDFEIEMGSAAKRSMFKMQSPKGKETPLTADDQGRLRDADLSEPGMFSVRNATGKEVRRLAVNIPAQESDLATLSADDFQKQLVRVPPPEKTTLAASLFGSGSNQKDLWRVLLLGVLALLFIEVFVANRSLA